MCGVDGCGNIEHILDPQILPVSLRTVGKMLGQRQDTKNDDSKVEFQYCLIPHLSYSCNLHGDIITYFNKTLTGGCNRCLDDETADKPIMKVSKLNKILMEEASIVSEIKKQGENMVSDVKSITRILAKENKMIKAEKERVNSYFDRLHNSLELREWQVVRQIDKDQEQTLRTIDELNRGVNILEELLEKVEYQMSIPRSLESDGEINLAQVVKMIVNEETKAKRLLQDVAAKSSKNLSIDPNFLDILKSCVYVEVVKVEIETPPESSTEDVNDDNRLLSKLKEIVVDNSAAAAPDTGPEQEITSTSESKSKVLKRLDLDPNSSIDSTAPTGGIIDINYSDDSSDSDITIDSEVEDSFGDHSSSLTISVPRFLKIECQVIKVDSPSNITVMSSEDKQAYHKLQTEISHDIMMKDRDALDISTLEDGDRVAVKTKYHDWVRAAVVKMDEQVHLDLIDLGRVCILSEVTDVRRLDSQFLKTPRLAFTVKLDNLIPLGNGNQWSNHARERLNQLIAEASTVEIEVRKKHIYMLCALIHLTSVTSLLGC